MIHYPHGWASHPMFTGVGALIAVALLALLAAGFIGSPNVPTASTLFVQAPGVPPAALLVPESTLGPLLPPVSADAEPAQPLDTF